MDAIARTDIGAGFPLPQAILSAGYAANLPPFKTCDDGTDSYYHRPWEALASIVGGDSRYAYSTRDVVGAFLHLFVAKYLGPFSYLFGFWR